MTVRVQLQSKTGSWSEEIATFTCEEYYEVCITALETWAKKNGHIITESVEEEPPSELRIAKKVLLRLIDDSYDTLRNCPEARQDPSNIHATVKELKGAIDEIDRHINIEENDNDKNKK